MTTHERNTAADADNIGDPQKIYDLLDTFRTVMLVSHAVTPSEAPAGEATGDRESEITSRPMGVARLEEDCTMHFMTDADSAKVYEIRENPVVHVIAQDSNDRFVSVRGTARVSNDRALIRDLWSEPYKVWFPDGPESPEIRVVTVSPTQGEYWDNHGKNKIKYLLEAAKAYATGTRPENSKDEYGRVEL